MEVITTMKNPGNLGFLVLSRRLLTQMFAEMYGKWHSDSQAYVYLLMAACFTDQGDTPGCLKRGELFFSGRELSLRFAWSRRHVNHFIGELEQNGVPHAGIGMRRCRYRRRATPIPTQAHAYTST